jgi:hypothetical protein
VHLRHAEVEELHERRCVTSAQEDVGRLDVPVYDAERVSAIQGAADLREDL